jgi:Ca2+-binding RTX toxin-like protein
MTTIDERRERDTMKKVAIALIGVSVWLAVAPAAQAQVMHGSEDGDVVFGTPKSDSISGHAGFDFLFGRGGGDFIHGNGDSDWVQGGRGVDVLRGHDGHDILVDDGGTTSSRASHTVRLYGGPGNDTLFAFNGEKDVVDCGDGADAALVDPKDNLTFCDTALTTSGTITHQGFPFSATFGTVGNDEMDGTDSGNEIFLGGLGTDVIDAAGGAWDIIVGGKGSDVMTGGDGLDQIVDDDGTPGDIIFASSGNDTIFAADGAEGIVWCSAGIDIAYVDVEDDVDDECETLHYPTITRT